MAETEPVQPAYGKALRGFGHQPEVTGVDIGYKYRVGPDRAAAAIGAIVYDRADGSLEIVIDLDKARGKIRITFEPE